MLGRRIGAEELAWLEELDARQWARLNPETTQVLELLASEGAQLALLSNMPAEMSCRYESDAPWPKYFEHRYFSGRLGMVKPDPRIYQHVLADLGAAAADVVFIDDNPANIEAAKALGMGVVLHAVHTDLRQELALFADRS